MNITVGRYIAPDGQWFDIQSIGKEENGNRKIVIYMDSKGKNKACSISDIRKKKWRLITDADYGLGGAAGHYK